MIQIVKSFFNFITKDSPPTIPKIIVKTINYIIEDEFVDASPHAGISVKELVSFSTSQERNVDEYISLVRRTRDTCLESQFYPATKEEVDAFNEEFKNFKNEMENL